MISGINGLFDASAGLFLIFKLITEKLGVSLQDILKIYEKVSTFDKSNFVYFGHAENRTNSKNISLKHTVCMLIPSKLAQLCA